MKVEGLSPELQAIFDKKIEQNPYAEDLLRLASDIRYLLLNFMLERNYDKKSLWMAAALEECDVGIEDVVATLTTEQ